MTAPLRSGSRSRPRLILGVLIVAGFSYTLQQTMVVPTLPLLQRELDTTTAWATWIITAFLLTSSVATPLLGNLGDQYGKRRLLVITLAIFFVGSVGCALSWNLGSLLLFRAVQGVGNAIFPLSFAIIRDELAPARVNLGLGLMSTVFGVGGIVGLVVAGPIVEHFSWRMLFVLGAVVIGCAAVLAHRVVPESTYTSPARLDVRGAVLLAAGLAALLLMLTQAQPWGWTSARSLALFALAALLLAAWVRHERVAAEPMVDMRMLARAEVLVANLGALISGFLMFGMSVAIPIFVQIPRGLPPEVAGGIDYGFGVSAGVAGLFFLPSAAVSTAAAVLAGLLGRRLGAKTLLFVGMALFGLSMVWIAIFHATVTQVVSGLLVFGVAAGIVSAVLPAIIADSVLAEETGVAMSMNTVLRTVGGVLGAQLCAALIVAHPRFDASVPAEDGFVAAFWVCAALALGAALTTLRLPGLMAARADFSARQTAEARATTRCR